MMWQLTAELKCNDFWLFGKISIYLASHIFCLVLLLVCLHCFGLYLIHRWLEKCNVFCLDLSVSQMFTHSYHRGFPFHGT